MRRSLGIICILLGLALIIGSAWLFMKNQQEDITARESSAEVLTSLIDQIRENTDVTVSASDIMPELELQKPLDLLTEEEKKMTEVVIKGVPYIGYLSIPKLKLDLPIISTWTYKLLNVAPCRFTGTVRGEDLVLMAHNYSSHFGKISQLELGDRLSFTDMDGELIFYEVVGKDVLEPTAVEEMTSGDFDLTLFTCTYGGEFRVTIYCDKVDA